MNAGEWSVARAVCKQIRLAEVPDRHGEFFACAAELAAQLGDVDLVKTMVARTTDGLEAESAL
jgi:hypothetical protein